MQSSTAGRDAGGIEAVDVAVVGAGPAGIAAAVAARRAGASVVVVDEYPAAGGQIWRRRATERDLPAPPSLPRDAREALTALAASGAEVIAGASVWGVGPERTLLLAGADGTPAAVRPRALVLATGAYDRPVAFPGWTLPGVLTAGGAQALAKGAEVLPGRRVLLAGAGPFLLPVATQLAALGAEVVAVAEATRRRDWLRQGPRTLRHPERLADYGSYRARIARARIPFLWGHVIVRAEGDERVEAATLARADAEWRAVPGTERRYAVDAVCTAYGFLPATELARALGCALHPIPAQRHTAVARDARMQTSVPGIFVAGEAGGVGGAALASLEGELAGAGAAAVARGEDPRAVAPPRELELRRRRAAAFARVLDQLFAIRPGLRELADAETVLCRCEDVRTGAIDRAAAAGAGDLRALKVLTRVGQGPCQGRICAHLVADRLPDVTPERLFNPRPPLRPVSLATLVAAEAAGQLSSVE